MENRKDDINNTAINIEQFKIVLKEIIDEQTEKIKKVIVSESQKSNDSTQKELDWYKQETLRLGTIERQYDLLQDKYNNLVQQNEKTYEKKLIEKNIAENKIKELNNQIIKFANNQNKIEIEKEKLQDELKYYRKQYFQIDEVLCLYNKLSDESKQRLKNIFGIENTILFICALQKWNTIEGIWGFTKRRIIEDDNEDCSILSNLFRKIFLIYNENFNDNYRLIEPHLEEKFDSDKHSIKGTRTDGNISEVLLDGIYDRISNRVIFKAIVKVK